MLIELAEVSRRRPGSVQVVHKIGFVSYLYQLVGMFCLHQ